MQSNTMHEMLSVFVGSSPDGWMVSAGESVPFVTSGEKEEEADI